VDSTRRLLVVAAFSLFSWAPLGACSRSPEQTLPAASSQTRPQAADVSPAVEEPRHPSEAEVQDLLARWTAAQSTNDFPAYERLYASKFTGVKRAGASRFQYGRDKWMADRKTMIAPGLAVEASDVKMVLSPIGARVTFVQHYKSPRFEDVGTKELFVIPAPDGPRIQREEMLTSSVAAHAMPGESLPIASADAKGVYLKTSLTADALKGAPWLTKKENLGGSAEGNILDAALDADVKAIIGRTFTTYDGAARPCTAVVKSLTLRAYVTAWIDTAEDRAGYVDDERTSKSKARTTFELGSIYLYGAFENQCPDAVWALQGSSTRVAGKTTEPIHRGPLVKAFRALPRYVEIDRFGHNRDKGGKHWEDDAETSVFADFRLDGAPPRSFVSVRVTQMCNEFDATLTAVFDATDPEHPKPRGTLDPEVYDGKTVIAAMDSDGDGELEFVTGPDGFRQEYSLLRRTKSGLYTAEVFFLIPTYICPC
jgi:hypothetical protein